jgi:chromosome segregation ATPase
MSATPDSTFTSPEQRIADLERQLAEYRAESNATQRQLAERTIERDEALQRETATAEVLEVINSRLGTSHRYSTPFSKKHFGSAARLSA